MEKPANRRSLAGGYLGVKIKDSFQAACENGKIEDFTFQGEWLLFPPFTNNTRLGYGECLSSDGHVPCPLIGGRIRRNRINHRSITRATATISDNNPA